MPDDPPAAFARSDRAPWVGIDPSEDEQRRLPLSRPRIVRAALRLVDDRGLDALTMRALARELEVSPMALYNHVRDKDELVELMVDLMLGEVDLSPTEGDWVAQLRALACSYHQALTAHKGLARVYRNKVTIGPRGLLIIEQVLALLRAAGFSEPDVAVGFYAVYNYIVGHHQIGRINPVRGAPAGEQGYFLALPAEQIPTIMAVAPYLSGPRRPEQFEGGLDLLLAGLRVKLAAASPADA